MNRAQSHPDTARELETLLGQDTGALQALAELAAGHEEALMCLGITDGRAFHIKKQVRSLSADALRERYLSCVEANYAVTSGQLQERAALDKLLIKLAKS